MSDTRSRVRTLLNARRFDEAKSLLLEICEKSPEDAQSWFLLGAVHGEQNAFEECARCSSKAVSIEPGHANAHYNLARAYVHLGRPRDAIKAYQSVVELRPDHIAALRELGHVFMRLGSFSDAAICFERVRTLTPNDPAVLEELGNALSGAGRAQDAIACFKAAVAIQPDITSAQVSLVRLLCTEGRQDEALACCDAALHSNPDDVGVLVNRGITRGLIGQVEEARADYLRAIALAPQSAIARSALLMNMNYSCDDPQEIFSAHRQWDRSIAAPLRQPSLTHGNDRDQARRLRVGYVSPNFYRHSVAYFFEPLLASHDAREVETYCYADVARPDPVTERLRAHAHHWRDIRGLAPAVVADLVRRDAIDKLVDLGGHTAPGLLLVFARKPAPIQVTWLGYPNTTGMQAMDYRLTDECADPAGIADAFHTEALIRLPTGFLCYRPFANAPPVSPSPSARTGRVTFGSFNVLQKITPAVLKTWARILAAVPGSRLMLKRSALRHAEVAARYRQPFVDAGVEPDRVILHEEIPLLEEHLALYSQVDVGLDTFPYNGTTTTCEALWMGVPVICLAGNRHAGRVGLSILTRMQLTEFVSDTPDEYVRNAVELANSPARLSELRGTLRHRMTVSPLCDAKAFAGAVEDAYRAMWQNWCNA